MKTINLFILLLSFISCNNKTPNPNTIQNIKEVIVSSDLDTDTIAISTEKENKSTLTLKVKAIEDQGGNKYVWVKVKVLSVIKNNTREQIPDSLLVASYSWLENLQEGETYIVYLVPYPLGSEDVTNLIRWILLEGDGSIGATRIQ